AAPPPGTRSFPAPGLQRRGSRQQTLSHLARECCVPPVGVSAAPLCQGGRLRRGHALGGWRAPLGPRLGPRCPERRLAPTPSPLRDHERKRDAHEQPKERRLRGPPARELGVRPNQMRLERRELLQVTLECPALVTLLPL